MLADFAKNKKMENFAKNKKMENFQIFDQNHGLTPLEIGRASCRERV